MAKRLLMVHHANGREDYACPKCGAVMAHRDNYSMRECNGDIVESGSEFLQCTNPDCMITSDYPRMNVRDFKNVKAGF